MISGYILFSIFSLLLECAWSLPTPTCNFGLGLVKEPPNEEYSIAPAKPGECGPCKIKNCGSCSYNVSKCWRCSAGYGPAKLKANCGDKDDDYCKLLVPTVCARCPAGCGSCRKDAAKCETPPPICPSTAIKVVVAARQVPWKGLPCRGAQGDQFSNGYRKYTNRWVKDGICMDCIMKEWRFRGNKTRQQASKWHCNMLQTARNVAANAFKACYEAPKLTLKSMCEGPTARYKFDEVTSNFIFEGQCAGETKEIIAVGGYLRTRYKNGKLVANDLMRKKLPSNEWTWAVAPMRPRSGDCKYVGKYNIGSLFCHRQQLVYQKNCSLNAVKLEVTDHNDGAVFGKSRPLWKLNITSGGTATAQPILASRKCGNTALGHTITDRFGLVFLNNITSKGYYTLPPIDNVSCHRVNIFDTTRKLYLAAASDCTGFRWVDDGKKAAAHFVVEKRCVKSDDEYSDFYCVENLYNLNYKWVS